MTGMPADRISGWSRRALCGAVLVTASLPLAGCGYRGPDLRYRLSILLDTPGGRRQGAGVSADPFAL